MLFPAALRCGGELGGVELELEPAVCRLRCLRSAAAGSAKRRGSEAASGARCLHVAPPSLALHETNTKSNHPAQQNDSNVVH
jgi:hypothetical protein